MAGPVSVSALAQAATRVRPAVAAAADDALRQVDGLAVHPERPRVMLVGIGRTPPKTTQSLVEEAAKRGMTPGEDIIVTRYADLRIGKDGGVVQLARGTGADGLVVAGQGREALFLFRGGGNLKDQHLRKIAQIQSVEGATALTDLSFIERAGSKAITYDRLKAAGLALADTIEVRGADEAITAFDRITKRFGADTAVLKKVNSLGGKDVHFVRSHDEIRQVIARDPDAGFVMQEFLPFAKDQDVRVHMVWSQRADDFEVVNAYVRNRTPFQPTPNLANGGYPTPYVLSPWEEQQALQSARVLAEGSPTAPLHVGLDFFPRRPITASTVEANARLVQDVRAGAQSVDEAVRRSADSVVIGEAASSAGTKGTELVLGEGINPVTARIIDEIVQLRGSGRGGIDAAAAGAARIGG
jgi:glutathione synthase/RimK-type ligase-like ATP-grasp enzyme